MNKLTKLLSVFVIAGAMAGAGSALAGCKPKTPDPEPECTHQYTYKPEGAAGHKGECSDCDDKTEVLPHEYGTDNVCDKCGYDKTVHVTAVEVTGDTVVEEGQEIQLSVNITPENADNKTVIWKIDRTYAEFAEISPEGILTAKKAGQLKVIATVDGVEAEYDITVETPANVHEISRVKDFLAFRAMSEEQLAAEENRVFKLMNDIDLDGVVLEGSNIYFTGATFDGQGYSIKNAMYKEAASNKTGILVRELRDGGKVQNVKFVNCHASLEGETIGIVAGMATGTVTISQVEFNGCTVKCNNYAGLCIGRTNSNNAVVTLKEITAKNGVMSTVVSYGGTLIGDIAAGKSATERAEVNIFDCDLDMELKGSNANGGFLSGRIRNNTDLNIKNVILRNAICPAVTGLVCGGGNNNAGNSTVTVENLYVMSTNADNLQSCALPVGSNPVTTFQITYTNCYVSGTAPKDYSGAESATKLTAVEAATADVDWLKDTLKLDFTKEWTTEQYDTTKYRLAASSTNVKTPGSTIGTLKIATANAQVRFEKGTEFNYTGLSVTGIYSDGVNLVLNDEEGYDVETPYDKDKAGKYTVTVKSKEDASVVATYEVEVVEQTDFTIDTQFAKLAYVLGEKIDLSKLLIYGNWSDGQAILTNNYTTNADELDMTTAGAKELSITMEGFDAKVIKLSVIETKPEVNEGMVTINVDASATLDYAGAKVDGVETFNTINEAVDYLVAAKFGDDVDKVMYVKNGTYTEKITIPASLKNLKIVGESIENTKIEYDAVEDSVNPLNGSKYMMDCATLHVNAENFTLENISVNNTFDYIHDNTKYGNPQGFALTIAADGAFINNVSLYGNQDTLFFKKGRAHLKDSTIMGNVDFIFGENDGLAFFDHCVIKAISRGEEPLKNNGYVTAMKGDATNHPTYGYIFNNCEFTDDGNLLEGSMSLGRPWGPGATVTMINCSFSKAYSTVGYDGSAKSRWFDMSGNSPLNAHFSEYGSTGEGAITEAVAGGSILTAEEAANYTLANLLAMTNGGVTWKTPWAGTNEKITITVKEGTEDVYAGRVCKGIKLTADLAAEWFEVEGRNLSGLYTDAECTEAFDYATVLNAEVTLYATYEDADPTVKANVKYTYDGTAPEKVGKLLFSDMATNGDWLRFNSDNASITFKGVKGTIITMNAYQNSIFDINGDEVVLDGDNVAAYTVKADGDVTIKRKAGVAAYIKTLELTVPITESTTIDLLTYDGGQVQGATKSWNGIEIDATTGKFNKRDTDIQVNKTTVLKLLVADGTTIKVVAYNGNDDAANWTIEVENGVATLTAINNTYIKALEITCPAKSKTYSYTYKGENGEEWTDSGLSNTKSTDDPQVEALKVENAKYLVLNASGTSATVAVTGFTTSTGNAAEYLRVEFLDASGAVVGTLVGTCTKGKVNGAYTFANSTFSGEFASVRFSCHAEGKGTGIVTVSIEIS